ncbi:MAG: hypothetical protein Q8K60_03340 [Parachlamydiaceae bacterium]|nr:hypothetical protein [Parachlamydiaceae bacterium]
MINNDALYDLIQQSNCNRSVDFETWLKTNKSDLEIPYIDISMAFWHLNNDKFKQSSSLTTKKVDMEPISRSTMKNTRGVWQGVAIINNYGNVNNRLNYRSKTILYGKHGEITLSRC